MSRIINGYSHKALQYFRSAPAALAVFWDYSARTNKEGVAYPSIRGLANDTGWGTKACMEARQWLVACGALEKVPDYIRPEWRDLPEDEKTRRLNLDQSEYYRPTGTLTVDSITFDLLYVPTDQETEEKTDTEVSHVARHPTSTGAHIGPDATELSTKKESKLTTSKGRAFSSGEEKDNAFGFSKGQTVFWAHEPRGGYGYVEIIECVVQRFTPKRVVVLVPTKDGRTKERALAPTSLSAERPALQRKPDPIVDVLARRIYNISPTAPIGKQTAILLGTIKGEIMRHYSDMTGEGLDKIFQEYLPLKPRKLDSVLVMLAAHHENQRGKDSAHFEDLPDSERDAVLAEMFLGTGGTDDQH